MVKTLHNKQQWITQVSTVVIGSAFLSYGLFAAMIEPSTANAATASDQVIVTLNVDEGISITDGAASTMAPNLSTSQNTSIGSSSWNVKTNSSAGYTLTVIASTDEAMKQTTPTTTGQFQDFNSGSATPTAWNTGKGSNLYTFGFSAYGSDTSTGSWGSGATCGTGGTIPATMNYAGFASSTPRTIASTSTVTTTSGATTTVCFAAEQVGVYAPSGAYQATVTGTATTN